MRRSLALAGIPATVALIAACSHHTVAGFSEPVGITFSSVKPGDVVGTILEEQKNINTESGNPYGKFVNDAKAHLGGANPGEIDVSSTTFAVQPGGAFATLDQIFIGRVRVQFQMSSTGNVYAVEHIDNPTGAGPDGMIKDWDPTLILASAGDYAELLGGQFKVIVVGPASPSFTGGGNSTLQTTFDFVAFK